VSLSIIITNQKDQIKLYFIPDNKIFDPQIPLKIRTFLVVFDRIVCRTSYQNIFPLPPCIRLISIVGIQAQPAMTQGIINIPRDDKFEFKLALVDRCTAFVNDVLPYAILLCVIVVALAQGLQFFLFVIKRRSQFSVE